MNSKKHVLLSILAVGALAGLILQRRFAAPVPATTRQLWSDRDAWTGRRIEVVGELKEFGAGTPDDHFALEDDGFRVGVRPAEATFLGRRVRARGVFVFTEKTGGYLESPMLSLLSR
ncbi:MAG: hypothetical protein ACHQ49_04885 [Elusimicrobiota bacterium]